MEGLYKRKSETFALKLKKDLLVAQSSYEKLKEENGSD